jgi:ABC-type dipeptide/oligopeptide/nickel transport system permease subunit
LISAFVGSFAGYVGGKADSVISWFINLLLVVPAFFLLVLISPLLKDKAWIALIFFIAAFTWMVMAQVIRAQTKSLRDRDFVKAARFMGVDTFTILRRHIIPNVASLLIIDATLGVVYAIIAETSLSYFGFGIQPPQVSLGTLLADGSSAATTRPWAFVFPAGALILFLFAVSLIGDALRDAVDPTSGATRD